MKIKEFDIYQKRVRKTAFYPNVGKNLSYPCIGLAEESGEVCGKVKRVVRDDDGILSQNRREEIKKELGDVLFYVAAQCWEIGIKMSEAAQSNLDKIADRKKRNKMHGSGDNR